MALPIKIKQWLNNRGITDAIIATNNLDWNGNQIVIPIFDPAGNFLFNKYRRNPFGPEDVPKYTYEKGATAQLYGAHKIKQHSVIITEGEMDALLLESRGYLSVTSTGGASTFKDEWLPLLTSKEVYICFDNDDAGMKGAAKLLTKLPAKLVIIPKQEGVKDVTDFLIKTNGSFPILLEQAKAYPILCEPVPEFKFIKDVEAQIKKYSYFLEHLLVEERNAKNTSQPFTHLDYIRQLLLNAIDNLQREIRKMRYFKKPVEIEGNDGRITNEDVLRAKAVPIETLFIGQLRKQGGRAVGLCPFHSEKTGSFVIYLQQNKWYCFGEGANGDSIDFYMKQNNVDFITAVKTLCQK